MAASVRISAIGNSMGVILPKEVLSRLHLVKGDELFLAETPDGIALSPYQPGFDAKIEVARRMMRQNRDALRKLAE